MNLGITKMDIQFKVCCIKVTYSFVLIKIHFKIGWR